MTDKAIMLRLRSNEAKSGVLRHFPPFLASLGVEPRRAHAITNEFTLLLNKPDDEVLDDIGNLISREGLGKSWGDSLTTDRAEQLAQWIAPQLRGERVLDILCGDGAIAVRMEIITGKKLHLVERHDQCGVVNRPWFDRIEDFESLLFRAQPHICDTAVLCTVLHHELDPLATLALAAKCASQRVVIVENCIESLFGKDYHLLIDAIFNRSLYRTCLAWPGEHRTAEEWGAMCTGLGSAHIVDRKTSVPGVPLPHTIIVLELDRTR